MLRTQKSKCWLLLVGREQSCIFTKIVATPASRKRFAFNAVKYLRHQGLDGLDLDWEFPTQYDSPPEDRQRFTEFIKVFS